MEQAKEVPGDPRGSQCTSNSQSPTPCHHVSLIKKAIKLPSHRYLPAPTFCFHPPSYIFAPISPSSLPFWPISRSSLFRSSPLFTAIVKGARTTGFCKTFHIGCGKLELVRNGYGVIFVGGGETLHGTGCSDSVAVHGNVIFIKE